MAYGAAQFTYLIGKESTWGSAGTANKDSGILVNDVSTNPTREVIKCVSISDIEVKAQYEGTKACTQTVSGDFQHGRMFTFIIGTPTHTNSSGDWKHTFTVQDQPDGFTSEAGVIAASTGFQVTGNMVESAELSIALNETLKLSVTSRGKFPTVLNSLTENVTSTLPCFPHSLVSLELNNVKPTQVQNLSVAFNKTLSDVNGISSNDLIGLVRTGLEITVSATLTFDADTYHDHFVNNDVTTMELIAINGTAFGSGKRGIELTLVPLMASFTQACAVGGLVTVDFTANCLFSALDTYDNISNVNFI